MKEGQLLLRLWASFLLVANLKRNGRARLTQVAH